MRGLIALRKREQLRAPLSSTPPLPGENIRRVMMVENLPDVPETPRVWPLNHTTSGQQLAGRRGGVARGAHLVVS
ncbi:MAG TPA: hypothetical protein VM866_02500 [Pyrinomonadaceae bacterium]|nr:hypothetical protein [Pyrinomonadaceae bacterium]